MWRKLKTLNYSTLVQVRGNENQSAKKESRAGKRVLYTLTCQSPHTQPGEGAFWTPTYQSLHTQPGEGSSEHSHLPEPSYTTGTARILKLPLTIALIHNRECESSEHSLTRPLIHNWGRESAEHTLTKALTHNREWDISLHSQLPDASYTSWESTEHSHLPDPSYTTGRGRAP